MEIQASWLHGVARQTAVRARSAAAKRKRRERQVTEMPEPEARQPDPWDDLRPLLDQELARLPANFRVAVVLCDLEGRSHKDAARHLGWPMGSLASRLSRGRRMLAKRLARRGLAPPGGALAAVLSRDASAGVPASLVSSTVQAGSLCGAGQAATAGVISPEVASLTEGVLQAMSLNKLETAAVVLFLAGMVALGGGLLTRRTAAADQPEGKKKADPPPPRRLVKEGTKPVAAPLAKGRMDLLEVRAEGKGVKVRAVFAGEELHAVADRMSYDTASKLLVLESAGEADVRVQRGRGKEVEHIRCKKVVIDQKAGTVKVEGASSFRFAVPMLGPVPIALDFGFPVVGGAQDDKQDFSFFTGLVR